MKARRCGMICDASTLQWMNGHVDISITDRVNETGLDWTTRLCHYKQWCRSVSVMSCRWHEATELPQIALTVIASSAFNSSQLKFIYHLYTPFLIAIRIWVKNKTKPVNRQYTLCPITLNILCTDNCKTAPNFTHWTLISFDEWMLGHFHQIS